MKKYRFKSIAGISNKLTTAQSSYKFVPEKIYNYSDMKVFVDQHPNRFEEVLVIEKTLTKEDVEDMKKLAETPGIVESIDLKGEIVDTDKEKKDLDEALSKLEENIENETDEDEFVEDITFIDENGSLTNEESTEEPVAEIVKDEESKEEKTSKKKTSKKSKN